MPVSGPPVYLEDKAFCWGKGATTPGIESIRNQRTKIPVPATFICSKARPFAGNLKKYHTGD
jgi:hypothetical protein